MKILATFHTHYGAMSFLRYCKTNKTDAKMSPVPRELSSSCGVCVRFESAVAPPLPAEHEDMECCYIVECAAYGKEGYKKWIQES